MYNSTATDKKSTSSTQQGASSSSGRPPPRKTRHQSAPTADASAQSSSSSSSARPPKEAKAKKPKAPPGETAQNMTRPREPAKGTTAETQVQAWNKVATQASLSGKQDATCMSDYMYDKGEGKGALKYQPIKCSKVNMKSQAIKDVLNNRRPKLKYTLTFYLPARPSSGNKKRKALVTLDTGLRLGVQTPDGSVIDQLIWSDQSDDRVKYLLVPDCEAKKYKKALGKHLTGIGVGLVGWDNEIVKENAVAAASSSRRALSASSSSSSSSDEEPVTWVYGFGASRRAAQLLIQELSKGGTKHPVRGDRMVMIDGNVKHSDGVIDGYETDNEGEYDIDGKPDVTTSGGWGSGTPKFSSELQRIPGQGNRRSGEGGTLEQVVTIGFGLPYDVAFVGGGEDVDLTDRSLQVLNLGRGKDKRKMCSLRAENTIEKIALGDETSSTYSEKLDRYKRQLAAYEGKKLKLAYRPWGSKAKGGDPIKYGDLATFANYVAKWNGKEKVHDISCLMVEMILRRTRATQKTKWRAATASEIVTIVPISPPPASAANARQVRVPARAAGKITISKVKPKKKKGEEEQDISQDEAMPASAPTVPRRTEHKRGRVASSNDDSDGDSDDESRKRKTKKRKIAGTGRKAPPGGRRAQRTPPGSASSSDDESSASSAPSTSMRSNRRPTGVKRKLGSSADDVNSDSPKPASKKRKKDAGTGETPGTPSDSPPPSRRQQGARQRNRGSVSGSGAPSGAPNRGRSHRKWTSK